MARFNLNLREIGERLSPELAVVMPVYNEQANIEYVLREWTECLQPLVSQFVFVIVNDGSTDATQSILERIEHEASSRYTLISKPNSGHGNSCRVGYDISAASSCEWILQIDSDGQCDPRYFHTFWENRQSADCIFGVRRSRDDGVARALASSICRLGSSILCRANLPDPNVPYRLIRRTVLVKALSYIPANFNIHNVALSFILRKLPGIRWSYVDIHFRDRYSGESSLSFMQAAQWGSEMLLELARLKTPS